MERQREMNFLKEGTIVTVNPPGDYEFKAIVRGISGSFPDGCTYILEPYNQLGKYSCITMSSLCVKEDLCPARDRAIARGIDYMNNFIELPLHEKIEIIAKLIFRTTYLDPFGYPNGQPSWEELPDIDTNFKIGLDKYRFLNAAEQVFKMLNWKQQL